MNQHTREEDIWKILSKNRGVKDREANRDWSAKTLKILKLALLGRLNSSNAVLIEYTLRGNHTGRGRAGQAMTEARLKQSGKWSSCKHLIQVRTVQKNQAMQLPGCIGGKGKKQENKDSVLGLKNPVQKPQLKRNIRGVQRLIEDLEWAKWCPLKSNLWN